MKCVSICLLILFSCNLLNAQGVKSDAQERLAHSIDSIINTAITENKIPGAVLQIKKNGSVVYKQAYGYAQKFNYEHEPLPVPEKMTTEHLFDIASLTKVVGT